MIVALSVLLVAAVVGVALLLVVVVRLRRELADARSARVAPPTGPDSGLGRVVVVVEVRNHAELAARRTRLARRLHSVSPTIVRGLVHRELVRELQGQLVGEGVDADVRTVRLVEPER